VAFQDGTHLGILQIVLHSDSFDWMFVPIGSGKGNDPKDQGTADCS
jgi:hypothetical protein